MDLLEGLHHRNFFPLITFIKAVKDKVSFRVRGIALKKHVKHFLSVACSVSVLTALSEYAKVQNGT